MSEPFTEFFLEAPGGLIKIKGYCENKKVKFVEIQNLPSFVDQLDVKLNTPNFGSLNVSTVFGGDSFLICDASDFDLSIQPENAKKFVEIAQEIIPLANKQLGFHHPSLTSLNYISFCQFVDPVKINSSGIKEGMNTVSIRPGKLDRSPCGTGTSARLALMRVKNEINVNEYNESVKKITIQYSNENFDPDDVTSIIIEGYFLQEGDDGSSETGKYPQG